ncbi:hypothetical protein AGDE_13764 [Angomonas deanei]|uniref:Zinc finger, C3HC4 type (RING finger)/Ring finger domain/RING-type zinc-finger/zinc finger of C3HC4-type, RING, putative n=1 Tax=Angomonas deanei TaxID=59799 RepID=A0A7G2CPI0_9TRYP|nr:hypothetical protein AGDE_13764 [Angomonas deanei]CAD2221748.1 Zinc finger, C3HC4 type (RING finger)/Ring finger domain/RING-type zinc-finger/zinc finger of C3HC4-type, RING, putative [Angomonas deanei]|eukprot:EPY21831.1 hypothetical protein AGDE_13764 [Angomonas deanei]
MYAVPLLKVADSDFTCPVCYDLYSDPCSLVCGHVFCKSCIARFLEERPRCPLCNTTIKSMRVVTPIANLSLLSSLFRELVPVAAGVLPLTARPERVSRIRFDGISSQVSLAPSQADEANFTQRIGSPPPPPSASLPSPTPVVEPDERLPETPVLPQRVRPAAPRSLSGSWSLCLVPPSKRKESHGTTHASLHLGGDCVLCGLNIMDRTSVRRYLKSLLKSPTSDCSSDSLSTVTEAQLGALLGALWEVQCCMVERGRSTVYCTSLAHHNCLAWASLLHTYTSCLFHEQTRFTTDVVQYSLYIPPLQSIQPHSLTVLQKLTLFLTQSSNHSFLQAATGAAPPPDQVCYICGRNQITQQLPYTALQPCCHYDQCGRLFHYPCALLAGEKSCVVFGLQERDAENKNVPLDGETTTTVEKKRPRLEPVELWCGPCYREGHKRTKKAK